MATTLTYDPSNDPEVYEAEEARDAEFLAIGQQLEDQQNELLAGKYQSAAELESAYIELQKAYSKRSTSPEDQPGDDDQQAYEEELESDDTGDLASSLWDEYEANNGVLTQETADALGEETAQLVEGLMAQVANQPTANALSEPEIQSLQSIVGGEQEYAQIVSWAAESLPENEINAYDNVMNSGSPEAIYFAIQALQSKYQNSVGTDGKLIQGQPSRSGGDAFRSMAELVRAQRDPRYDNDPAYRGDVISKLERSGELI
jgi:hypothetical protein